MNASSITRQLAERIVDSDPLTDTRVVQLARDGVLDWLASAVAARDDANASVMITALGIRMEEQKYGHSSVLGRSERLGALDAALMNGYLSHALDYDDVHESVRGHPSAVILSALLAEAEERGASGAEFLAAYIIGIETMCRLGIAIGSRHYEEGWHNTSTLGVIAAAAACSRLASLDVETTVQALGLAATQAGGLRVHFGTQVKPLHAGLAARSGLMSMRLAESGFKGSLEPLSGSLGFFAVFARGQERPEKATENWGNPWQIIEPGLWLKKYPCCSAAHHAADAALSIYKAYKPDFRDIDSITVTFPPGGDAALVVREPVTGVDGRFSVEYVVAAALADGELGLSTFTEEPIRPELRVIAAKVQRRYDSELAAAPGAMPKGRFAILKVKLTDGTTYVERVDCPRGAPGRPLSSQERLAKYEDAVQGLPDVWHTLADRVMQLELWNDMTVLISDH